MTEPIVDREVDEICDRWLRSLGYVGICEIEIKQDTRDGRFKLIEANPRLSGSGDAAPCAGVDLVWLHYLDLIGRPVSPVAPRARVFRHITVRTDAVAMVNYRRAGLLTWRELFSVRPRWPSTTSTPATGAIRLKPCHRGVRCSPEFSAASGAVRGDGGRRPAHGAVGQP